MTLFCRLKAYHIGLLHQRMCVAAYLCEQMHDPTADQIYSALHAEEPAAYFIAFPGRGFNRLCAKKGRLHA